MVDVSRRAFLRSLAAIGGVALTGKLGIADPHKPTLKSGVDMVTLGRTGLKTSVLGIGTGSVGGSQQLAMGSDNFGKMVRYALERNAGSITSTLRTTITRTSSFDWPFKPLRGFLVKNTSFRPRHGRGVLKFFMPILNGSVVNCGWTTSTLY